MKLLNSIVFETISFVTLTYRYNQQDEKRAYKDLRAWHKRLSRAGGDFGAIWRAERQERGAMHYHIFCVDVPTIVSRETMIDAWMSVTGQDGDTAARLYGVDRVDFGELKKDDMGVVVSYLAKYATKDGEGITGKQWGVLGRGALKIVSQSYDLDGADVVGAYNSIVSRGGVVSTVDGGGIVARLYHGHIGFANPDDVRIGYNRVEGVAYYGDLEYHQLSLIN